MRYNDLINESNTEEDRIAAEIRNSKWFKESKYDLYRGLKKDFEYKKVYIDKQRDRKPTDTRHLVHDFTNEYSNEKLGVKIRNGLYTSMSYREVSEYGSLYLVFPLDNTELYFNPKIKDFYIDISMNIEMDGDVWKDELKDYVDGIEVFKLNNKTENEIICFGDIYIVSPQFALKHRLIKADNIVTPDTYTKFLLNALDNDISTVLNELDGILDFGVYGYTSSIPLDTKIDILTKVSQHMFENPQHRDRLFNIITGNPWYILDLIHGIDTKVKEQYPFIVYLLVDGSSSLMNVDINTLNINWFLDTIVVMYEYVSLDSRIISWFDRNIENIIIDNKTKLNMLNQIVGDISGIADFYAYYEELVGEPYEIK